MNRLEHSETVPGGRGAARRSTWSVIVLISLPLFLLGLAGAWLIKADPLRVFSTGAPPVEKLTIERVILDDDGIHLKVRAGGSEPMVIAQVQVDDAYWRFTQSPGGPLARLTTAWLDVPYPWITGESHVVTLVTNTGATFAHTIEVAVASPSRAVGGLRNGALLGFFVGILPVAIGMMFFPLLRGLRSGGMRFVLALTCGLLVFLLGDMLADAFELAGKAAPAFQGPVMVVLVAGLSMLLLVGLGRRRGAAPRGLALATFIALGIGLHNFGEGLAIGAALAAGAASLGGFLVLGFTVHNLTEGIGIAAPLVRVRPSPVMFAALALLAGAPAILGIWLGSVALEPQWAALALAIGAGAIMQVVIEVGALALSRGGSSQSGRFAVDGYFLGGFLFGVLFMYVTALAIKI